MENTNKPAAISWRNRIGYACGTAPDSMVYTITSVYVLFFMTDVLGVNAAVAGTIVAASTVICAFVTPVIGIFADNYNSPKGRRLPLMKILMLGAMVCTVLIFLPVNLGPAETVFLFITVVGAYSIYTAYCVPYYALGAELTEDYNERNNLLMFKVFIAYPVCYIGETGLYFLVERFSAGMNERMSWFMAVLVMAVMVVVLTFICTTVLKGQERPVENIEKEKFDLAQTIKDYLSILSVKICRKVMIYNFLFCVGYMAIMNTVTYAMTYCVAPEAGSTEALVAGYWLCNTVVCVVSAPICTAVANKFDKKTSVIFFLILSALWQAIFYFLGLNSFVGVLVWSGANAFACSAFYGIYQSMLFDTTEVYELKYGERKEGSIVSMSLLMQCLGEALASFLVGVCLSMTGYNGEDVVSEATSQGILATATLLPAAFMLFGLFWIFTHKLNRKRFDDVKEALERKRNGEEIDLNDFRDLI
ncbi:MAG: MFS transporter [Firmicutes bacterium]|nr:MFS transporter [Bacillota bacterium]